MVENKECENCGSEVETKPHTGGFWRIKPQFDTDGNVTHYTVLSGNTVVADNIELYEDAALISISPLLLHQLIQVSIDVGYINDAILDELDDENDSLDDIHDRQTEVICDVENVLDAVKDLGLESNYNPSEDSIDDVCIECREKEVLEGNI